jgi:hypothetical protein
MKESPLINCRNYKPGCVVCKGSFAKPIVNASYFAITRNQAKKWRRDRLFAKIDRDYTLAFYVKQHF